MRWRKSHNKGRGLYFIFWIANFRFWTVSDKKKSRGKKFPLKKKYVYEMKHYLYCDNIKHDEDDDFTKSWWRKIFFSFEKLIKEFNACDIESVMMMKFSEAENFFVYSRKIRKNVYQKELWLTRWLCKYSERDYDRKYLFEFTNSPMIFAREWAQKKWGKINE